MHGRYRRSQEDLEEWVGVGWGPAEPEPEKVKKSYSAHSWTQTQSIFLWIPGTQRPLLSKSNDWGIPFSLIAPSYTKVSWEVSKSQVPECKKALHFLRNGSGDRWLNYCLEPREGHSTRVKDDEEGKWEVIGIYGCKFNLGGGERSNGCRLGCSFHEHLPQ